jgi:hypothetical protein
MAIYLFVKLRQDFLTHVLSVKEGVPASLSPILRK